MSGYPVAAFDRVFPARGVGWQVACEIDFTRLGTQSFSDGDNTVAGVTFSAANSANATTFGVTNGTGLVVAPGTNTEFSAAAQTAPYLQVALWDLIGPWSREDRLFVQVAVASAGLSASGQSYGIQIGADAVDKEEVGMLETLHDGTGLQLRSTRFRFGTEGTLDAAVGSEPAYIAFLYREIMFQTHHASASVLVGGQAWPYPRDMSVAAYGSNIVNGAMSASNDQGFDPTTDTLRFWAERDGTPAAFTATFLGMRVLAQRWGTR